MEEPEPACYPNDKNTLIDKSSKYKKAILENKTFS
jgi:hypothetical protein